MSDRSSYSALQITLHWLIAVLVFATWWLGEGMGRAFDAHNEGTLAGWPLHVWLGLSVLVLVLVRLVVRWTSGAPDPVEHAPGALGLIAKWSHYLLYLLLLAAPVLGAIAWFSGSEAVAGVHPIIANGLLILAGLHAVAALYHHFVRKDGVMKSMVKPGYQP